MFSLPVSVYANGPAPASWLSFSFSNLPNNVSFADILIQIAPEDSKYTPVNMQNLDRTGFSIESEIVSLDASGFRSFTFHYKDAVSSIEIYADIERRRAGSDGGNGYVQFCEGTEYHDFYTQYEDLLANYRTMKLAFLDDEGTVISVSNEFQLPEESGFHIFMGYVNYDYETGDVTMEVYTNLWFLIMHGLLIIFLAALSVGIEVVTAVCFGFGGWKIGLIAIVNTVTQITMRLAYLLLPLPHLVSIILLEALVYSSEFLIYRKSRSLAGESTAKLLIYTIAANSFSFLAIAFLNSFTTI